MSPGDPAWERVEELFHRALELPPEDRHASLAGEEPGVAAAVRRLLRGADVATGFLQTSTSVAEEPSLGVGDQVGAWRVDAWLDGGGMGEVYRVTRASGDYEQAAALKLMRRRPDPSRFVRERQLLARLEHPNIARLIDGGESGGRQFMVVELVDGEAITESCLRRNTPERARLELFLQLCAAVAHAHGRLVLHRDIKPSNVLVTAQGEVKLVDFGVAHSLDAVEGDLRAPLTVAYAAPEQLAGDPVSTATDVYAMGLVLEELLACRRRGRRPGSAEADGVADGPQVQVDLRAILSRALESDPSRRYPSAEALAEDVRRYLTRRPVMARRGGRLYRAGLLLSRYRVAATALGLLALSLALGWWTSARSADRERDAARRAQSALAAAEAAQREQSFEARTLEGYRRSLQVLSADPAVDGGGPVDLGERLVALADSASGPFLDGSVRDGYLIYSIGQHFMHRYDFARAARVLGVFGQVPLDASGGDVDLLLEARSDLARAWHELGRGAEAA
ncbi:MAG: serine/threonine-protein kinase, partial [Acidobacteriota bacterium]